MKIVYFNYMNDLYGSSIGSTVKALKLLGGLREFGWDVAFYWRREGVKEPSTAPTAPPAWKKIVRPLLFTPKELLLNARDFWRELQIVKKEKPDALVARLDAFRISGLFVAKWRRIPLFIEADGANSYEWIFYHGGKHIWKWALLACERLLVRHAAGVFAQSNVTKNYYMQQHGLSEQQIAMITNGADVPEETSAESKSALKTRLGITPESLVIGFLGSMHHWHGVGMIKSVLQNLAAKHANALFVFIGSGGAFAESLKNSLTAAEAAQVLFTGAVPNSEVQKYIELFDIAIAPYPNLELFYFSPVKIFDYMAVNRAIVAPEIGQISELLQHGETALLYPPGDLQKLQEHIERLAADAPLRERLGRRAGEEFRAQHTWRHKSAALHDYLRGIMQVKD